MTEGPNFECDNGISKTGMACHIYAAATGPSARRVNPEMSEEDLTDISNGIWMCYTHGKLIDTDESTYTVDQLKTWREVAEIRAKLWQQFGRGIELSPEHFTNIPLPKSKISFESLGQENHLIGEAIYNSCTEQIWGKEESHAIRDVLIEVVRNAFEHGNASNVEIEIAENSIKVFDDGSSYDAAMLLEEARKGGGFHSVHEITSRFSKNIYFTSVNDNEKNCHIFSVISSAKNIKDVTPCHIEISRDYYWGKEVDFKVAEYCKTVYVIFPKYFALSDALKLPVLINEHLPKGKELIFVGEHLSSRAVEIMTSELSSLGLENIRIINFNR
ncbi:hypothetical protein HKW97_11630 [Pseudomonas luteola]|uniref:hypothetical protein n=1 Tax=Pseudomonas luteola TaxID=47886 RepID=UPI00388E28BD